MAEDEKNPMAMGKRKRGGTVPESFRNRSGMIPEQFRRGSRLREKKRK